MIAIVFGLTLAWDLFQFGLTMPILNRITGERQDLSQFAGFQGNLGALLIFLASPGLWPQLARRSSTAAICRFGH